MMSIVFLSDDELIDELQKRKYSVTRFDKEDRVFDDIDKLYGVYRTCNPQEFQRELEEFFKRYQ